MLADLVLTGGIVVDGTGDPPRPADVAVTGGRITAVARPGELAEVPAATVLRVPGRAVAPGFIDAH
ncbi:MAG TPA: N-acyl-D-glutamate deacylase, partial [Nakamurella sp.]|nr:N-acyl-D-glutamate deacylase [Nakamurella sp.]